jgi:hypothetical protein
VFKSLADTEHEVYYLKEDTIARFLEIPDILHASPVVFQMVSYVGAFPFLREAPAVLGLEQIVMLVTIMTERYRRVLANGAADRRKLIFKSLAVYDRRLSQMDLEGQERTAEPSKTKDQAASTDALEVGMAQSAGRTHAPGFAVDEAVAYDDDDDEDLAIDEDELVLAAFESISYVDVFKHGNSPTIHGAMIPADNFRKLTMLLLLVAPLSSQESLSAYSSRVVGDARELESLRTVAESVLASFLNVERSPGIKFHVFNTVVPTCFPHIFNGLNPLFEHFLFSKNLDLNKHRDAENMPQKSPQVENPLQPLLQDKGSIMTLGILAQLSFFLPGSDLFRRLRLLYSGDNDGFSMGSFESKVFNWRAPTILLVRGTRLFSDPSYRPSGPEASFLGTLPPKRFPNGSGGRRGTRDTSPGAARSASSEESERLTFGLFVGQPWRHTNRECFGDEDCTLFQLEPVHDVFPASSVNKDYVSFLKSSISGGHAGVTFGCPPPGSSSRRPNLVSLGGVSLVLDSSFEFGCFTHDFTAQGGAFRNSVVRKFDFQDRFEVECLEVWGCGGDEEAKHQAERWAWEAREAEARRRVNLGTGDLDADRALLEMAGLIGGNRSGGSMG